MSCICNFLYDILPTKPDKIQAWASIFTTGIAAYALFTWKHQDKHSNLIKLMENMEEMRELFLHLRDRNVILLNLEEISSSDSTFIKDYKNIEKKLNEYKIRINSLKSLNTLATASLKNDNPVRKFFNFLNSKISDIKINVAPYGYIVYFINSERIEMQSLQKELNEILKFSQDDFERSDYSMDNRYSNVDILKNEKNKEFSERDQNYKRLLANRKIIDEILFTSLFSHKNNIDIELDDLYKQVGDYINNYNYINL